MTAPAGIDERTIDWLWRRREDLRLDAAILAEERGRIEQELLRRALEANPAFRPGAGGSVQLAGDGIVIAVTYSKTYEAVEDVITGELLALTEAETGPPLITDAEYKGLVKVKVDLNGTSYNALLKRGGRLAEVLGRARVLKSSSPQFTPKQRST